MRGQHDGQKECFRYQVDLDRRVRADHPLRAIRALIDFQFVRDEVAYCSIAAISRNHSALELTPFIFQQPDQSVAFQI